MMIGSYFINCWASLFAFTIYFLLTFQHGIPLKVIIGSFISAAITFLIMYPFRLLLGYIIYTPQDTLFEEFENSTESNNENDLEENNFSKYMDESPEDIANVVRNMMNQDESISAN